MTPSRISRLQRSAGNHALANLLSGAQRVDIHSLPHISIQRTEESAALLTQLAVPQVKPGPAIEVQKDLAARLEALIIRTKRESLGLYNIGGILLDDISGEDSELADKAAFVELGGYLTGSQSAGISISRDISEEGFSRLVVEHALPTMIDAQQIRYLRSAGLPNEDWKILVEVHYFRARPKDATGFHKDTQGQTLFVNLNYHIDQRVVGPEYVVNPPAMREHDELISGTLPREFLDDLGATRERLEASRKKGKPEKIGSGIVERYGYVAFVDEAVHHATPYYGHRFITGSEFKAFLEKEYPAKFAEASKGYQKYKVAYAPSWWYPFATYVDNGIIKATEAEKWLAWTKMAEDANKTKKYTREEFRATMKPDEFDRVLETVGSAVGAQRTGGSAAGFFAASIPKAGTVPVKRDDRPPLKRTVSNPDFRRLMPPPLAEDAPRRFFRTWVRAVPTSMAKKLKRL